jgi:hypothetical protein
MARIRTIKPIFFKNEELAETSFPARLLFIGLWTLADKEGRMEDRPKRIKAELFPYDSVNIEELLSRLQSAGFIVRYKVEDAELGEMKLIQINNFSKHQRITGSEADTQSEYPAPSEGNILENLGNTLETPRTTGKEGKGKEMEKERKELMPAGIVTQENDIDQHEPLGEPEEKKEKGSAQKEKSLYAQFMDDYNNFFLVKTGYPAKIDGKQGIAAKSIIAYLKTISTEKTDEGVLASWRRILAKWDTLDTYLKNRLILSQINSELMNIINQIKNGTGKNNQGINGKKHLGTTTVTSEGKHPGKL